MYAMTREFIYYKVIYYNVDFDLKDFAHCYEEALQIIQPHTRGNPFPSPQALQTAIKTSMHFTYSIAHLSLKEWQPLQTALQQIRVPYTVSRREEYFDSDHNYLSRDMMEMEEYCFARWAAAYQISVAYRCVMRSTLWKPQVIRAWWHNDQFYMVHKCWLHAMEVQAIQRQHPTANPVVGWNSFQYHITFEQWEQLDQYMHEQFWTWKKLSWDVDKGYMIMDGNSYTFEGYRLGEYKWLDAYHPEDHIDPGAKAVRLFNALRQW
jgi:hypothetical protein